MKILHVVPSFRLGGMERVICSIINLTSDKYDHEVLSLDGSKDSSIWIKVRNIKFVDFQRHERRFNFFKELYKTLKNMHPDFLMTYNWGATDAIWIGRILGIRNIIHSEHGFNIDEIKHTSWKKNIIRFIVYHASSKVVIVSRELKYLIKKIFFLNKKLVFIPNGINIDYYTSDTLERRRVRGKIGLKDTDFVVGFSGRLDPVKNFDFMLDIVYCCIKKDQSFKLLIIGDGSERQKIEAICRKKNIEEHVLLVGQQTDVLPYLRALDVFLLTSFREQMPMSALEAMSVGTPVVSSRVGEMTHLIKNGEEGFVRELEEGVDAFALLLLHIKNSKKLGKMRQAARNKIVTHFQDSIMVQKYNEVIAGLR